MKMKIKKNLKIIIPILIIIICFVFLIISIINITKWKMDSNKTEKQIESIEDKVEVLEVEDSDNIEIIQQEEEIDDFDPYFDYINMNLINVDFKELKIMNKDTKGWIQVNGTNINYPFVQTSNNDYYLNHSFDRSYNQAGWVFLDYRNNIDTLDKNTILYAHSRLDTTMFGSLRRILKSSWVNNETNHVIKLSTESANTLWQVFSAYVIPTTNDYIQVNFSSLEEFDTWVNMIKNRSFVNFNTSVNEKDHILTLSTCYDDEKKTVLHAKLIKKEEK